MNDISILDDMPENMPLYKDSGLWNLLCDDASEIILTQDTNESTLDFIKRCVAIRETDYI